MSWIELKNVSIEFPVYGTRSFRKALISKYTGGLISKGSSEENTSTVIVKALQDISISLKPGDRLGLVGHNGAGKTTLLKVMAGVLPPTTGEFHSEGRLSPMFNAGVGMDVEDTGYENINTIGLYLGMSSSEIKSRLPDIESFCELGDFLKLPVRIYSAGMIVRLTFAVATCLEPDILLLDEGLGAGDARFAEKAKRRVDKLVEQSSMLVLASHSTDLIRNMCNKAILLNEGRIIGSGSVEEIISTYDEINARANSAGG